MQDPFWGEPVVLKEIRDAFVAQGGGKLEVIIGVRWGHTTEEVIEKLKDMHISGVKATDFYVLAGLTEERVDELSKEEMVFKMWHNREIKSMVDQSSDKMVDQPSAKMVDQSSATIKASAALKLFGATGDEISWAVLDTGIKGDHDDFKDKPHIVKDNSYNFTNEQYDDTVGHGTHVAGIIRKLAPKTKLYDFKVLGKNGGTAFMIIEAMNLIRKINREESRLKIHGANLSLGGPVPVGSYGCGFSPECQEANRLVDSGVVVCVAASNDGFKTLATYGSSNELEDFPTFLDMGISDPGNAEKVITVGSTSNAFPHRYGISYFSSKGPTGDGRFKPDVVAPGERIESAGIKTKHVLRSGTSMATAHVSAAIAQFLSVKKEFIGDPNKVKEILMSTCTDLGRDRYFQGAGLIDVLRMIQAV